MEHERATEDLSWFFVIGAAKAATTTICARLAAHPQVVFCNPKEPSFFSFDDRYALGLEHYRTLYPEPNSESRAAGEGSVSYSATGLWPRTASRIAGFAPEARIVYGVRHPLDRIGSNVQQRRFSRRIDPRATLLQAVRQSPDLVDAGRYATQLRAYHEHFDAKQVLVYFFDDFAADPSPTLAAIAAHVRVDPARFVTGSSLRLNAAEDHEGEPAAMWRLRQNRVLRAIVPRAALHAASRGVRARVRRPIPQERWTPEAIDWVRARLEDDVGEFLRMSGQPIDYWKWEPTGPPTSAGGLEPSHGSH